MFSICWAVQTGKCSKYKLPNVLGLFPLINTEIDLSCLYMPRNLQK